MIWVLHLKHNVLKEYFCLQITFWSCWQYGWWIS